MKLKVVFPCMIACLTSVCFINGALADSTSFGTSRKLKLRENSVASPTSEEASANTTPTDSETTRAQLDPNKITSDSAAISPEDEAVAPKFGVNKKLSLRSTNHVRTSSPTVEVTDARAQLDIKRVEESDTTEQSQFGSSRKTSQRVNSER